MTVPLLVLGFVTCYGMSYAWHSPTVFESTRFVQTDELTTKHTFSIIIPLRDESYGVVSSTVGRVLSQTHPHVQAVLSVGYDDPATIAVANRLISENPGRNIILSISQSSVHNKPTQLNAALRRCSGDFVGILDAESQAAPDILRQVDTTIQETNSSVVQGAVVMANHESSWVALRASLEYYINYRSKMHWSVKHNFILMGGNTVFFRRALLEEIGGWDETNLAEDAEIGVRLTALSHDVVVVYDPHLVTREEAPVTIKRWEGQRTRWDLGFLQTIHKGVWRHLPTRQQRRFALWSLMQPTLMAMTGLMIPLGLITIAVSHAPLWAAMPTFSPAVPLILMTVFEAMSLRTFGLEFQTRVRVRDYLKLVVSMPPYQLMLAWAAIHALVKFHRNDFRWNKTEHPGTHLTIDLVDRTTVDAMAVPAT